MFTDLLPNSLNILLVESAKADALLVETALSQTAMLACSIIKTPDLNSALRIIAESDLDIILLDVALPDAEASEGLRAIHNIAPKIPVIMLARHQDEAIVLHAIECGAQDYLIKDQLNVQNIKKSIYFAIQRKRFELMLINQANSDMLTGLANRSLFEIRVDNALERAKRSGDRIGILFIDLNHFKRVNDNYGHNSGDKLLQEAARRMKISIRPYDGLCRFGGDEFALLIDDSKGIKDFARIAQKIINQIIKPFVISGQSFEIGVSIGIATCTAGDNISRETLIAFADQAMYRAKRTGNSEYRFHEPVDTKEALMA